MLERQYISREIGSQLIGMPPVEEKLMMLVTPKILSQSITILTFLLQVKITHRYNHAS